MAHESEPRFLVLHGLRLKGFAETAALAGASGLLADVAVHAGEVAAEIERSGARADVEHAHSRFLDLNGEVLDVCTRRRSDDRQEDAAHRSRPETGAQVG